MKLAALLLRILIAFLGFLPKKWTALPLGILSALLDATKGEMIVTGQGKDLAQVEATGEAIDKDVLVSQAKRATAVNPCDHEQTK